MWRAKACFDLERRGKPRLFAGVETKIFQATEGGMPPGCHWCRCSSAFHRAHAAQEEGAFVGAGRGCRLPGAWKWSGVLLTHPNARVTKEP